MDLAILHGLVSLSTEVETRTLPLSANAPSDRGEAPNGCSEERLIIWHHIAAFPSSVSLLVEKVIDLTPLEWPS